MNMACSRIFSRFNSSIVNKNVRTIFAPGTPLGPVHPATPADEKKIEVNQPTHTGQVSVLCMCAHFDDNKKTGPVWCYYVNIFWSQRF